MLLRPEDDAVGLHGVYVPQRGVDGYIVYLVLPALLQDFDVLQEGTHVVQHHRVVFEGIAGSEERAAWMEAALCHGLDHDVDVIGVVEVLVGEHDGLQAGCLQFAFGGLDERPRAGVQQYLCSAQVEPESARGQELVGYHDSGSGRAQEGDGVLRQFCLAFHSSAIIN